jgi:ribonuclease HII
VGKKTVNKVVKEYIREDIDLFMGEDLYAGIDEVGVSSIAGSLVCSVVVLPENHGIQQLPIDSKKLKENSIRALSPQIKEKALYYAIFAIAPEDVDFWVSKIGILNLQKNCWRKAVKQVRRHFPKIPIILDGKHSVNGKNQGNKIKGVKPIIGATIRNQLCESLH